MSASPINRKCPNCGTELAPEAAEGLCPTCLLGGCLEGEGDRGGTLVIPMPEEAQKPESRGPRGEPGSGRAGSGTRIRYFGDYELLEEIARGGMGVVYKARQVSLNRTVAVKMILAGPLATLQFIQRFRTEAEAAASLQHPNIVAIHEVGEHDGQHYFSMDFVEGTSLSELTKANPLPARRAARYVQIIAAAIHYAHGKGILHRDLKPSNVLLDAQDQPRITDFGLAKRMGEDSGTTLSGQVLGTPSYLPPEQASNHRGTVGPQSDVYSLGAVLYHLVTGRPPFLSDSVPDTLAQVLDDEPVSPRLLNRALSKDLETICLKCLEKEPPRRYASAQALAEDLDRWLKGEPILARPVTRVERMTKWAKRKPVVAALTGAVVLLGVSGVSGIAWQWRKAESARRVATEKLWDSYLAQARANRWSGQPGRRFDSLEVLAKAAAIRPALELRNEAIACMTLPDIRVAKAWEGYPPGSSCFGVDEHFARYARSDRQGNISVREVDSDREIIHLPGEGIPVDWVLRFSPCGRYLAAVYGNTGNLRVWDLAQGKTILQATQAVHLFTMDFSPDGQSVVYGNRAGEICIGDLHTGAQKFFAPSVAEPYHLRLSPDGQKLAIAGMKAHVVEVRHLKTAAVLNQWHWPQPRLLAWHPNSDFLAVPCGDGQVCNLETSSGRLLHAWKAHGNAVTRVGFSHDGAWLASTGWDTNLRLWEALSGKLILARGGTWSCQFSADDRFLGPFRESSQIGFLEVANGHERRRLAGNPESGSWGAAFSPDGRWLASAEGGGVRISDPLNLTEIGFLPMSQPRTALFAPDGKSLITSGQNGVRRWPLVQDPKAPSQWRADDAKTILPPSGFEQACRSSDGRYLAVAHPAQGARIVDLENPARILALQSHAKAAFIAASPDFQWIATGTWQGREVKVWEAASGKCARTLPVRGNAKPLFSPDGEWLVTGSGEEFCFWETTTWQPHHRIRREGAGDLWGEMAFSPDGSILAIGQSLKTTWLVNPHSGQMLAALEPGEHQPLCFSPDGHQLVTVGEDHALFLWDLKTIRQQLAAINLDWEAPALPPALKPDVRKQLILPGPAKASVAAPKLDIPPRAANTKSNLIDLSRHFNGDLQHNWHGDVSENNLAELPPGVQTLDGVEFDLRGLVQPGLPLGAKTSSRKVTGILIDQKCQRLHFLHAATDAFRAGPGAVIGRYILHYADGQERFLPLALGRDLADWWEQQPAPDAACSVAWTGANAKSRRLNCKLHLFKRTWENPRPEVAILSLDFEATHNQAFPFLVALTVEL
jgi:eukaryotic-like serine/threonine-protein kinase